MMIVHLLMSDVVLGENDLSSESNKDKEEDEQSYFNQDEELTWR